MQVTFVRHGRTIENDKGLIQGHLPGQLHVDYLDPIKDTGRLLQRQKYDAIYCSDLRRCVDTLDILLDHIDPAPISYTEQLREANLGKWQGLIAAEQDWDSLGPDTLNRAPEGGETFREMQNRIISWLNNAYLLHPNDSILVVTHGGPIRAALSAINDHQLDVFDHLKDVDNGSLHHVIINDPLKPIIF